MRLRSTCFLCSGMAEGEVSDPLLGLRRVALREGDDGRACVWRVQPPAVPEQPPWQPRSPKLNIDDLPHGPTMHRRLAARSLGLFRICVFLCRFRADGAPRPPAKGEGVNRSRRASLLEIRDPLTSSALHEI